jgi:hypothetical protein
MTAIDKGLGPLQSDDRLTRWKLRIRLSSEKRVQGSKDGLLLKGHLQINF